MTKMGAAHHAEFLAAEAIAIGILANTVLKIGVAVVLGTPQFRRVTVACVGAMAIAIVVSIGVIR